MDTLLWGVLAVCVCRATWLAYECWRIERSLKQIVNGKFAARFFSTVAFGVMSGAVIIASQHSSIWFLIMVIAGVFLVMSIRARNSTD